ncbi:fungal-specific transcription factor domain-containing protein [Hypoxylon sp. FL0890]|nr:fungal-specific transcription factor domain-containing protein [Hypoxylon sp. FL0890]
MQDDSLNGVGNGVHTPSNNEAGSNGHAKRTRVLLSCAPCRNSKLKCDRATPCGQCLRKGKPDGCLYAPRREKEKPAKSMAARLKRLEGMVRGMIETDGIEPSPNRKLPQGQTARGLVVQGEKAQTFVGGTHFMAMLEDIEDLKSYFEENDEEGDEVYDPYENTGPAELIMFSRGVPKNKDQLLAILPEQAVVRRLMNRYFNSNSPSQHIVHVPTFLKEYSEFCKDPHGAPLHWIALLYIILALGVFFTSFSAPHELESDSPIPAMDRFKQYRGAAGWALIWGKYSQPGPYTLQAFLLYVEGDFMSNRENRMNSYLLSSVLIRLMLKMGLHRDPSKLPNITPYDGEMRRRMWNLATQVDLLVAFNLGLPSMTQGIESDTELPTHLTDTDFDKDTTELPPARPNSDYTALTYPINKARITRVFFLVAKQAHALTVPTYAEVMKVDAQIEETWKNVPETMKMKPIEECVMDPPIQVIQRFGITAIYQKSRCVHHRRYIVEEVPKREHDYSRRTCLGAALALLDYQNSMHEASKPGGMLGQSGWFVAALVAVNDFLLASMIVALVIQNEKYWEVGGEFNWIARCMPTVTRDGLLEILQRSHSIWRDMSGDVPEFRKSEEVVGTMLRRIQAQLGVEPIDIHTSDAKTNGSCEMASMANLTIDSSGPSTISGSSDPVIENFADFDMINPTLMATNDGTGQTVSDPPWMMHNGYDWSYFDAMTRNGNTIQSTPQGTEDAWLNEKTMEDFPDFVTPNSWNFTQS